LKVVFKAFKEGALKYMDVLSFHNYNMDSPSVYFKDYSYELMSRQQAFSVAARRRT